MHQSDDVERLTSVVTLYLDESATDDTAPIACVGGLLSNKTNFQALGSAWGPMLEHHGIAPPLHIKNFRRPNRRLAVVSNDAKRALFADAIGIINACKTYSVAGTVASADYNSYFDKSFRKEGMSMYGACLLV